MLEYLGFYGEGECDLCFVDSVSPRKWHSEIEEKLSTYKETVFIDPKRKLNLFIVLRLDPSKEESQEIRHITGQINEFMNYYQEIISKIKESQ